MASMAVPHPDELLLNLDASLRVHNRAQFFNWTQGLLQSLVRHRLLVCVLPPGKAGSLHADGFSLNTADAERFSALFTPDGFGQQILRTWQSRRYRPLVWDLRRGEFAASTWIREFEAVGADHLIAHGMHDARGAMSSFFIYACDAADVGARQLHASELAVPFLHGAWMRVNMNAAMRHPEESGKRQAGVLTGREQEILAWIYLGKSNFEIGTILSISPLTVKNHVQKILRKLNVVNRAQAVGKALDLRLIDP